VLADPVLHSRPAERRALVHERGDDEEQAAEAVRLEQRAGDLGVVAIAVVEGQEHQLRPRSLAPGQPLQLGQASRGVA
jgi:hypothetical protein